MAIIYISYRYVSMIHVYYIYLLLFTDAYKTVTLCYIAQARSQGGSGGSADPPLENQRSTFWNLACEIIKADNYKWLTIYLHQLLCTKPPTKWLQNLLSKGGSGGANL